MSWESAETKHTCPCENGTYTVIDSSNDWGQYELAWKMDCPECKKNYSLYTYSYYRSGLHNQGHRWIKTAVYEQAMELQNDARDSKDKAVDLARERYFNTLIERFSTSSKKAIWEVLQQNIRWYKSLGTFYKHTKGQEKHEYLGDLFNVSELEAILKIVGVDDDEIANLLRASDQLEVKAKDLLHAN